MTTFTNNEFIFNPFSIEFARAPYPVYKRMREECPIYYHRDRDMWLISKHHDVFALIMDSRMVRTMDRLLPADEVEKQHWESGWHKAPKHSKYVGSNLLDSEGDTHDRLRKLVFNIFTPAKINTLQNEVQIYVDTLINTILEKKRLILLKSLQVRFQVTLLVICLAFLNKIELSCANGLKISCSILK